MDVRLVNEVMVLCITSLKTKSFSSYGLNRASILLFCVFCPSTCSFVCFLVSLSDVLALPIFKQEKTSLPPENETKNPPFQYVLCAATSPAVKLHDETLTYLNQGETKSVPTLRRKNSPLNCKPDVRWCFCCCLEQHICAFPHLWRTLLLFLSCDFLLPQIIINLSFLSSPPPLVPLVPLSPQASLTRCGC